MGRIERANYIYNYLQQADSIIEEQNVDLAEEFCDEVIAVFSGEIDHLENNLTEYGYGSVDYIKDTKILSAKLKNYKNCIETGFIRQHPQSPENGGNHIDINNRVHNEVLVNVSFDATVSNINKLPESVLSQADKESLQGKIVGIELAKKNGESKSNIWDKVKPVLEFIISKGADVAIAAMPYIMSALQNS